MTPADEIGYLMGMKAHRLYRASTIAFLTFWAIAGCGMEKGLIFFPEKRMFETPADARLAYEDLYLQTADGVRINGWFVPFSGSRQTLLWFHGNAGNLSHRVDQLRLLHRTLRIHIFMIDYREYGRSEGVVTEEGTYQDALASYDYLLTRTDIDTERIVAFGQSLGAAVAVELAMQRTLFGLILEAPFTSVQDMAREAFPWLPVSSLLTTRYDTLSKIGQINSPVLILHGDRDEIVPFEQGRRIFAAAREPKTFYTIPGAGHNDTYRVGGEAYFEVITRFIENLTP